LANFPKDQQRNFQDVYINKERNISCLNYNLFVFITVITIIFITTRDYL